VTAPALPAGWVAANAINPDAILWVTSTTTPDSAPNDAFVNDPTTISDKRLDTPNINIAVAGAQVSFRNNYALEPVGGGANFYDGGVLEVSSPNINGGAFTDITDAAVGGSFVTGGYNGTISSAFMSPIGGRMAWSQSSNGYINTVANLGSNVVGQTIKLRFRMCSDSSVSGTGWRIDNVVVTGSSCSPTPTPGTPTPSPTPTPFTPTPTPGTPTPTPSCTPITEGFDDITTLVPGGWFMQNNSQPGPGTTGWFQGNDTVFPAQGGATTSYIGTNFNNGTGVSTLSNWLLTPALSLQNGVQLTFWTRTVDTPSFPDRLQVRMSLNGASTNVGTQATDVGDFTTLLLDINPTYTTDGYPNVWTQFTVTVSGIASPTQGRLALRYFVENGGPSGANSDYIGIDTLSIHLGCGPTPCPTASFPPGCFPKVDCVGPCICPTPTPTPTGTPCPSPTCQPGCSPPPVCGQPCNCPPPTPTPTPTLTPTPTPTPTPCSSACPLGCSPGQGCECICPTPTPTGTPSAQALAISTRLRVETGSNVLIGGFIVSGNASKRVVARGIGPSLASSGITDVLVDPVLELRDGSGASLFQNDNWQDDPVQASELTFLNLAPLNPSESAMIANLDPAAYTAILAGKNNNTGVGLVELYDVSQAADSQLANISTRGLVQTGDDVMIGGFILGGASANSSIVVRGIGPSLSQNGLTGVLADPTLELRDSNGALLVSNDNWQEDPVSAAQLTAHGLAPQNPVESGIFTSLAPGAFTAILAGKDGGAGIGLVEIYRLQGISY
jgi:hypothetical protein